LIDVKETNENPRKKSIWNGSAAIQGNIMKRLFQPDNKLPLSIQL
jgi:hypothetical protein